MDEEAIEELIERGATRALEKVGLHDEDARDDIRALRALLDAWRGTKATIWRTIVRWVTTLVLVGIAATVAVKFKLFGG